MAKEITKESASISLEKQAVEMLALLQKIEQQKALDYLSKAAEFSRLYEPKYTISIAKDS